MQLKLVHPKSKDPVALEYKDGTKLLYSYEVPVAAYVPGRGYLVTNYPVSNTTHARMLKWVGNADFVEVDQREIFAVITSRLPQAREAAQPTI